MQLTLILFLIGLGIFNAISSMTDSISEYAGVKDSDGLIGGLMLIGGIFGAVILPALSDKYRRRKIFLVICLAGMVPGIFGLSFAGNMGLVRETLILCCLFQPLLLDFCDERRAYRISVCCGGQLSCTGVSFTGNAPLGRTVVGMVFVALMSINNNKHLGLFMTLFAILTLFALAGVLFLRESPVIRSETNNQVL